MRSVLRNEKGMPKKVISIRWKLFFYLISFAGFLFFGIWLFQLFFLDMAFEQIKKRELINAADVLTESINSDRMENNALHHAVNYSMNILVYRTNEEGVEAVLTVDYSGGTSAFFPPSGIDYCYNKALKNDGEYMGKFAFGGFEIEESFLESFFTLFTIDFEQRDSRSDGKLVYSRIVEDAYGNDYFLLLTSGPLPVESMVRTWRMQFSLICLMLILAISVMVFLLYRKISAPLIRMTDSAKQLAMGRYDVAFSGEGYQETQELAETLNYASHELSKLSRLQSELIANVSHDLRTPLTMIKGYGEVMRDLPGENTPENMQVVIDEASRLSELVDDMLDLSKIQAGIREPEKSLFDLTEATKEVMGRYDAFTRHKGYDISFAFSECVYVYGDRGMLLQVLYNLINNAINYTGQDLRVAVKQEITPSYTVRISVTDTGEGILPEQMPLIWDRYYKVDKVHRRAMVGTGLGLSIVKGILELHDANFGVDSLPGKGSTFWFELPVIKQEKTEKREEQTF